MKESFYLDNKICYRINDFQVGRPTLIFVHGISGSSSAWLAYENEFEKTCNVLNFDLRGHGKSRKYKNENEYEIKNFSDDLFELLTYLKIEKFILVSHSFGVLIALHFLSEHKEMVQKAILISANFAPGKILGAKLIKPFLAISEVFKWVSLKKERGTHLDYSKYINSGDWNLRRMWADISNTSLRVYLWGTKKSYELDFEMLLDKINIPVLLIHGDKDTIFPLSKAIEMQNKIKNSRLVIIENSNHILVLNNFSEISKEIHGFINLPSS